MDTLTPSQRSRAMAHNRGRTRPERALASALWQLGMRYLTHQGYKSLTGNGLPGSPDLVFSRQKVAVFVDGCFWHGCPECAKSPEVSGQFWIDKIQANQRRDERVTASLEEKGWAVLRIPEHELRNKTSLSGTATRVAKLVLFPDGLVDTGKSPSTPDSRLLGNDGQVKRVSGIRHIQVETVLVVQNAKTHPGRGGA